jgi:amino acid adenylation domain-containing protein
MGARTRLAQWLKKRGVGPEVCVGVSLERSPELVVAVLGILKAGGAYVPLDPEYPAERLRFMVTHARVPLVLTQGSLAAELGGLVPADVAVVPLESDPVAAAIAEESAERPEGGADSQNLAYVIYTSGSTGEPKGVAMPHGPLVQLVEWHNRTAVRAAAPRTLTFAPVSFDVSFQELFTTLAAGGTLVLVTEEDRRDPDRLLEILETRKIDHLFLPFVALQQLAEAAERVGRGPESLKELYCAGEQLQVTPAIARFFERLSGCRLHNQYGPTETHVITAHTLDGSPSGWPALPPIGRPITGSRVYVLDGRMEPAPIGVPGELYLGGSALARGYLHRAELTAERFVVSPFVAGERLYRTGDLARWSATGELEFLGRADEQLKVRGYRIEPGEIENVLVAHPRVREAVVVGVQAGTSENRLAAYVVAESGVAPSAEELRDSLAARLPAYMVPSAIIALERLPLTPSGKVDRRALPAPDWGEAAGEYVAARTPTEELVASIYAQVLGVERVGAEDDFFQLGGHSLLAARAIGRLRSAVGRDVPLRLLFEAPRVADLAARVDALLRDGGAAPLPPVVPVPRDRAMPLSYSQQRLWFLQRMEPDSSAYNMPYATRLLGDLDVGALEWALGEVVRRHEVLRTTFVEQGGAPVKRFAEPGGFRLPVVSLEAGPSRSARRSSSGGSRRSGAGSSTWRAGPLLRASLARLGVGEHVLLLNVHHSVSDGVSMGVLARELEVLYAARLRGEHSPLPELTVQYADYAAWQRNYLSGELLTSQLGYWRRQLAGLPVLELPTDRPRPALQSFRGAAHTVVLSADLSQALKELGRREDATPFMTLLAAFQLVLGRWSGQDDFAVGTPVAGRTRAETEPLIGFFLNNLVLRAELTEDPSFRALLGRVRETTLGAFAHQEIPFERLLEELQPPRDLGRTPLFQVLFNLIPLSEADRLRLEGVESRAVGQGDPEAKFDLTLYATEGDRIRLRLVYNTDLFDSETAERLLAGLEHLLASAVADPERRISTLPLLDPAERALLASGVAEPRPDRAFEPIPASVLDSSIATRFREVAARMPDAPAVESGETVWSYGELASRADRVSHAVWAAVGGVVEGRVALLLGHDAGMVAGVLGVLGAGQAYVPLDPYAPADRLRRILADAAPSAIVTDGAHRALLETLEPAVPVVELESAWALEVDGPVEVEIGPDAAAYLLYTSGSTGEPKGVVQSQRGVLHHVRTYVNRLHVGSGDRLSLLSAYGFDASVMDLFGALLSGATLVPLDLRGAAVGRLATEVAERGITVYHSTPTVYRHLVAGLGAAERLGGVRLVVLGGEAVVGADVDRYRRHFAAGCLLVNGLGPTECTLALQQWLDHGVELERGEVPVGRAVEGVEAEVVNEAGEPVAEWATGELVLRSRYLAQGYWGRPDLTAAAFGEADEAGVRIYRTGDLGRRLPDGRIVFVGRRDGQVKVRGYRIETGEVESALVAQAGVREAVVLLREAEGGEPELAAYVVPAVGARVPGAAELREAVRNRLPEYMVPAAYAAIDAVPMTANGKVDRRALLAMEVERGVTETDFVEPATPMELLIAGMWRDLLEMDEVGASDNFYDLGGHSLLAVRFAARLQEATGLRIDLREMTYQTLGQLAATCSASAALQLPESKPGLLGRIRRRWQDTVSGGNS